MKIRLSMFGCLALAIACCSFARAEELFPKEQPPVMSAARLLEDGELAIRVVVIVPVQYTEKQAVVETVRRIEIIGGKEVAKPVEIVREVEVTRVRYAAEVREHRMTKAEFQVLDLGGKKVEGERLAAALGKERPVLVTTKPLDPFYAGFFKADILVIQTLPVEGKGVGVVPAVAPVPLPATVPGAIRIERIESAPLRVPPPPVPVPAIPAFPLPAEPAKSKPPK